LHYLTIIGRNPGMFVNILEFDDRKCICCLKKVFINHFDNTQIKLMDIIEFFSQLIRCRFYIVYVLSAGENDLSGSKK
jgi:hypothetical protein